MRNEPEEFGKKKQKTEKFWGFNFITVLVVVYIVVSAATLIDEWQRHPKTFFSTASQECYNACKNYSFLPVTPIRLKYDECLMDCEEHCEENLQPSIHAYFTDNLPHKICYPPCFATIPSECRNGIWNAMIPTSGEFTKDCWKGYWATHITEELCKEKGGVWDWE